MGMDPNEARARFESLFAAHYSDLMRYATRRVGVDAASDVVSGTFLVAWRRLADIPADYPRAWLYATARKVIANEMRGRDRRERLVQHVRASVLPVDDPTGAIDEQLRVRAVLAQLSSRDQEVLRLTEWDGLDIDEAAAALGCRPTALKVRLHRARRRFAQRLNAIEPGPHSTASVERIEGTKTP